MSDPAISHPYAPVPPAPSGYTLRDALQTKADAHGYHLGKLTFEKREDYVSFFNAQVKLGGTPEQLAVLHQLETTGTIPHQGPVQAVPSGTTVDRLLDTTHRQPNAQGEYELGSLRVSQHDFPQFAALQRDLAAHNPEALRMLYHLEHAPEPVTFKIAEKGDRVDRYEPGSNTIVWSPTTAVKDAHGDRTIVPARSAGLHEEFHWAGRDVGATLQGVPAGTMTNLEEKRVIDGGERRDSELGKIQPRGSHEGWALPARGIDTRHPSLTVTQEGRSREVFGGFQQTGRVVSVSGSEIVLATRGDGSHPGHRMTFSTEQVSLSNPVDDRVGVLVGRMRAAQANGEQVSIGLRRDGLIDVQTVPQQGHGTQQMGAPQR